MPQFDTRKQELQEKLEAAGIKLGHLDGALRDASQRVSNLSREKREPSQIRSAEVTLTALQDAYQVAHEKLIKAAEDYALHSPTNPR